MRPPAKFVPLTSQGASAYAKCIGCGCLIVKVVETTGATRTMCEVCTERQGETPQFTIDTNASKRRPPYERPLPGETE